MTRGELALQPSAVRDYEQFVAAHAPGLVGLAWRLTGHREDAHDLAQETLLACFRRWKTVQAASNPLSYTRRIMVNLFLSSKRRPRVFEDLVPAPHDNALRSPGESPTEEAFSNRDAIWRAMDDLSDRQRTVLVLRYWVGLEDVQIVGNVLPSRHRSEPGSAEHFRTQEESTRSGFKGTRLEEEPCRTSMSTCVPP